MKKILGLMVLSLLFFLVSCANAGFEKISPADAKAMREENSQVIFVDVREEYEYDAEHIQGAILLPLGEIEETASTVIPDLNGIYIVYCRSGNRSNEAANLLVDLGYENIYDMGGIIYWPYETVS